MLESRNANDDLEVFALPSGEHLRAVMRIFSLMEELLEVAVEILSVFFEPLRESGATTATLEIVLTGIAAGLFSTRVFPRRVVHMQIILPGASLLIAPLAAGWTMHIYGNWRRHLGKFRTQLATFRGGVLFAFSMALIRFLVVGLPPH